MKKIKLIYIFPKQVNLNNQQNHPSVEFFGYDKFIKNPDFQLSISQNRKKNWVWRLWRPFEKYLASKTGIGFRLDQILNNLKLINSQDIALGVTDSCGLPLLLLKKFKIIKPKIVFISAGLINNWENQQKSWIFKLHKWILKEASLIVCWSPLEEKLYKSLIDVNAKFILLESDLNFYKPNHDKPLEDFVLSVGRDIGRDWEVLFKVLKELKIPAKIITKSSRLKNIEIPPNVELHTERVDYPVLLDWYKRARLVIVSLQEINRFSGQRALLESLSIGKTTIVAKTKSLISTYNLKDEQEIIFYEPGNIDDLKNKIDSIYNDPEKIKKIGQNARKFAENLPKNSFYKNLKDLLLKL